MILAPNARAALGLTILLAACAAEPPTEPAAEPAAAKSVAEETQDEVVFAIIGDYGTANDQEAEVAALVDSLDPEFVVTVGDNTYVGDYATSVGGYYGSFLPSASATTSDGCQYDLASVDFYPTPGNHDTDGGDMDHYAGYFPWASQSCSTTRCDDEAAAWINDRYPALEGRFDCSLADPDLFSDLFYDVVRGPLHLISLNSVCIGESTDVVGRCLARQLDCRSADWTENGTDCEKSYCVQLLWMGYAIAQQRSIPWHLVFYHHVPYSTQTGGNSSCLGMRYDYGGVGATTVVNGHDHFYQRLQFQGGTGPAFSYFVNGAGGYTSSHACNSDVTPVLNPPVSEAPIPPYLGQLTSVIGYEGKSKNVYGAQRVQASSQALGLRFYDRAAADRGDYVDSCRASSGSNFGCAWGDTTAYPPAICCGNTLQGAPVACP